MTALPCHRRIAAAVCAIAACALAACVRTPPPSGGRTHTPAPGASASLRVPKATPNPSSLHMIDAETGWGDFFGTILRTTDGGRHWSDVTPPTTGNLLPQPGYFLDAQHAWVIQYGGYSGGQFASATYTRASVLRTNDGGATWHSAPLPLAGPVSAQYAVQLTFLDAEHGWALVHVHTALQPEQDDEVALFSTVDGGATWERLLQPGQGGLPPAGWKVGLTFRSPRDGWLTGRSAEDLQVLYVTHDGGRTWTPTALPLPEAVAHAAHGYTIQPPKFWGADGVMPVCAYMTGYWPTIDVFRTSDGGATWTGGSPVQANSGDDCVRSQLGFTDPRHGYFMDDTAYAFTTADGGQTWTPLHPTTHHAQVNAIDFVTRQLGWGVVWQEVGNCSALPAVVRTADGGTTWQVIAPPPSGVPGVPHSCPVGAAGGRIPGPSAGSSPRSAGATSTG